MTATDGRRLHALMITAYGAGPAHVNCGDCEHLKGKRMSKTYFKCMQAGTSNSIASDWRLKWASCGKYTTRSPSNGTV